MVTIDGRYDSAPEDRYLKLERSSVGLEIKIKRLSDDQQLGKITILGPDLMAFHTLVQSCCSV